VTRVVQPEELMGEAEACARGLLQNSPQAMRAVKQLLAGHSANLLDEEIEDAIAANALQRSTEDFREGVRAFLEHRRPEWPSLQDQVPTKH
jgi:methylglutaconyl-CoA hydratase